MPSTFASIPVPLKNGHASVGLTVTVKDHLGDITEGLTRDGKPATIEDIFHDMAVIGLEKPEETRPFIDARKPGVTGTLKGWLSKQFDDGSQVWGVIHPDGAAGAYRANELLVSRG